MRGLTFFGVGVVLLLLQSNLFRLTGWIPVAGLTPSLVLPLVLTMGVHEHSMVRGAFVAFALGYVSDLIEIAPVGLFTFTSVGVFLLARAAGVRLAMQTTMMQIALAFGFTILQSAMILVVLAIFGRDTYVPRTLYPFAVPHAIGTAILAPGIFWIAQKIYAGLRT